MAIYTADRLGRTDSVYHTLLPKIESKYPIVIVSWVEDFVFNEELLKLKDAVVIDFREFGWDYEIIDSHILGTDNGLNKQYSGEEWNKLNEWVSKNSKIIFMRELLKKDVSDNIKPIEYPAIFKDDTIQSKEQFDNRPISVNSFWGRSSEHRVRIHSEIWKHAYKKGFQPCDNVYLYNQYMHEERNSEKWLSFWLPHWARIDINEILKINGYSKLSLSWGGAGFKCFRTLESPINSVMVMHKKALDYAWSFNWDETNCILVDEFDEIQGIENALKRDDLYIIYLNGIATARSYYLPEYAIYLSSIINNA